MKMMDSRSFEVLDSKKRMTEREAQRAVNAAANLESSRKRIADRKSRSVDDRVAEAVAKTRNMNAPAVIAKLESLNDYDRQVYLLAEEIGPNRPQVLRQFPKASKSIREAFFGHSQPEALLEAQPDPDEGQPVDKNGKPLRGAALAARLKSQTEE